jgi:signal transduction histidine kinase
MTANLERNSNNNRTFPLGLKLTLALLMVAAVMILFLFGYFGPHAREGFLQRSDGLIRLSSDALGEMVKQNTTDSRDLLINLIRHTADSRRRHLMDLPLTLYEGEADRLRQALESTDLERSARLEKNVEILAHEMERRALAEVDQRLERLFREQTAMGSAFAGDIRRTYLFLAGTVFLALFGVLGFGLYRTVIFPLRQLRKGTQAVTRGDLEVEVPVRARDEVGGLSSDFAAMVRQLRESRESIRKKNLELEDLNRNLEAEVQRKTRHLEKTLDDLRRTQRQLIHAEKMASIGTLAGGVAHEFNNLIGGIRGCTQEALDTEADGDRRETLEVVLRAAHRAGEITDQLLRFSRQRAVKLTSVDVTATLEEALLLIEPDARKRGIAIERKIERGAPFLADSDALHQVFLNLYTNALQAMPEGGTLFVESHMTDRHMEVRITDTGAGIPAAHMDRIFEPFFTTKDQDPDPALRGSGLGLSVSYSILEAHGGSLEADSAVDRGASFLIRLPLAEAPGPEESGQAH